MGFSFMKQSWAILVAGGTGKRFGAPTPKQFLPLQGRPVLEFSLKVLRASPQLGGVVLVLPKDYVPEWRSRTDGVNKGDAVSVFRVTEGGATRQQSVTQGLAQIPQEVEWVLVHDAARPLVTEEIIRRSLEGALVEGAAVTAVPVPDTLKRGDNEGKVLETVARKDLYRIQTPQVFRRDILQEALQWALKEGLDATDEATLVEKMGRPVDLVEGSEFNFKITTPHDLELAEAILKKRKDNRVKPMMRIGEGYDVHRLVEGRELILGGVKIPFELGLKGHSDADALLHSIADALLGAAAAGDLGTHFPDSDPQFKDASSLDLLEQVRQLIERKGFQVHNVDATLICQRPKLAPFVPAMRENISQALRVPLDQVNVKATTEEGLGFTGNMEGLAAKAVVLLTQGDKGS